MNNLWLQLTGGFGPDHSGGLLLPAFDHPAWLLLIPPLWALAWWIARKTLSGWDVSRQKIHLAVRCLIVALVCATLAQPHIRWRAKDVSVVTVMDVSDSVPPEQRHLAEAFLQGSLAKRPPDDRFGVVTIARSPTVQSLPSSAAGAEESNPVGPTDSSQLQRGVELGRSIIPSDTAGRVLLISDANQTSGSLASAAAKLATAGVPIDVAPVQYDRTGAVRIEDLVTPSWVRDGDTISVRTLLQAGKPASGRLTLLLDGEPLDLDPSSPALSARVDLHAGLNVLTQQVRLPTGPVHRIEASFDPDDKQGATPQLLRAESVTFTSDRGRILVLADDPHEAAPFLSAITSDNLRLDVRPGSQAPTSLAEWSAFDAIVLFDQPASNFSQSQQADMARAVRDAGAGLLVLGGPNSYGAGGWIGSPLADALPVLLDPPAKRLMPMGALALIIDRSGSMASPVVGTGMTQQQIANEAALLAIRSLSREDQVAVITFSGDTTVDVPLVSCSNSGYLERAVRSIGPGGGTNLFPAIDAAAAELAKSPAGVKHIIILTDGETIGNPNDGVSKAIALKAKGVTLSTVAIGDGADVTLLRRLARAGAGRIHIVRNESSRAILPQILIKEAQTVSRTLIWEGTPFAPSLAYPTDALRGINGPFPGISGYVVTADRPGLSIVELRGRESDPILAEWQHGLGRVVAYTSDAATRWNPAWPGWGSFAAFWEQHLKWAMRPSGDPNAHITVEVKDDQAKVTLDLLDSTGERLNFARISARASPPPGDDPRRDAPQDVEFRQTGPGQYQATVDARTVGPHLVSLRYEAMQNDGQKRAGSVRAAIIRRSGEELRQPLPNTTLLQELARRTDGRVYQLDPAGADLWVREHLKMPEIARSIWLLMAIISIALFLGDVAARRIVIDFASLKSRLLGSTSTSKTSQATLATLAAAKDRAGARISHQAAVPTEPSSPAASPVQPPPITPAPQRPTTQPEGDVMSRLRAAKKRSIEDTDDRTAQ